MNFASALDVTELSGAPIDLRNPAPTALSTPVEALLEAAALAPVDSDVPAYLPEDFLTVLA